MAIFNRFPFSNAHELNLDWILRQLKDLLRRVKQLEESESGGGGDPGTTNYNDLSNKPKINNVTLQGNKSSTDLNIPTTTTIRAEINHAFQLYDPAEEDYNPPYAVGTLGYAIENAAIDPADIQDAVDAYLDDHPALTGMFTNAAKNALISLLEKVAYIDGNGQQYLNELITNLAATVTSISAVFTQGAAVIYDTDDFNTLKQYLVVTANYSDGTSATVSTYELSGTLTVGTSTITVTYAGHTDTFEVVVTSSLLYNLENEAVSTGNQIFTTKFLEADTVRTLLVDYTPTTVPTTGNGSTIAIIGLWSNDLNDWAIRIGKKTGSDATINGRWMESTNEDMGFGSITANKRLRFVIKHEANSPTLTVMCKAGTGSIATWAKTASSFTASDGTLVLGSQVNGASSLCAGTITKCQIHHGILSSSDIDTFFS